MPPNLHTLPFDVIFAIIPYLSLEDVVRVGSTCKQLETILRESTLCRRTVEVFRIPSLRARDYMLTMLLSVDRYPPITPTRQNWQGAVG